MHVSSASVISSIAQPDFTTAGHVSRSGSAEPALGGSGRGRGGRRQFAARHDQVESGEDVVDAGLVPNGAAVGAGQLPGSVRLGGYGGLVRAQVFTGRCVGRSWGSLGGGLLIAMDR